MSERHPIPPSTDAAAATTLQNLIMGFRITQLISVAAKLGLADLLARGPQSPQALAREAVADEQALHRLMRALASIGIFAERSDGTFELTPMAELLRSDVPMSLRGSAILYGEEWLWSVYGQMLRSVQTGLPAFDRVHGQPFYAYLEEHPDAGASFQQAMTSFSSKEAAALLAAYDFSAMRQVVDIGGGQGGLLAALLHDYPMLSGVLFDLPDVVPQASDLLTRAGLAARCECVAGDFFEAVPPGGDAYLLKSVLHNWDDASSQRILRNCREAMGESGRLLVMERVIPPGNAPTEAKLFDINMLVVAGGRERTEAEYGALFQAADFRLARIISTGSPLSIVEGVPAS